MADLSGLLNVTSSVLNLYGTLEAVNASRREGRRNQVAKEFEKEQLTELAGDAIAVAQRTALEERREADLVASRALAVAAVSGGAGDPQVVRLISNIKGEGAYRAGVAMYEGESKARKLKIAAATAGLEGALAVEAASNKATAYAIGGTARAISSGATWYEKYGAGGPDNFTGSGDAALIRGSNQG